MTEALAHAALYCRDVEASADFYTRVLGLTRLFTQNRPDGSLFYIYLHAGSHTFLELFPLADAPIEGAHAPAPRLGIAHLCLSVDDINAAAEKITAAGWSLDSPPKKGMDGNWQLWIKDPDGTPLEIMQMMPDCKQYQALEKAGQA